MSKHYLYIMREEGLLHCWKHKIGISNKPLKRQKQLQTGNAEDLSIRHVFELRNRSIAEAVENKVHNRLFAIRARGEWFIFPPLFEFLIVWLIQWTKFTTWR